MLNTDNAQRDLAGYFLFLQASGAWCKKQGNIARASDWGQGKNCTVFMFDNVANGCADARQAGDRQIILEFGAPPGQNITVILFGEFENLLEVDANGAVLYDIYQR